MLLHCLGTGSYTFGEHGPNVTEAQACPAVSFMAGHVQCCRGGAVGREEADGVVRGGGPDMRSSGPIMRRDSRKAGDTCSKVVVFYH